MIAWFGVVFGINSMSNAGWKAEKQTNSTLLYILITGHELSAERYLYIGDTLDTKEVYRYGIFGKEILQVCRW